MRLIGENHAVQRQAGFPRVWQRKARAPCQQHALVIASVEMHAVQFGNMPFVAVLPAHMHAQRHVRKKSSRDRKVRMEVCQFIGLAA
jgi:hypothetical protein